MLSDSFQRDVVSHDLDYLIESHPAMRDLVDLYRAIDQLQSTISASHTCTQASVRPPARGVIETGRPMLDFESIDLNAGQLAGWVDEMRELLSRYGIQQVEDEAPDDATSPSALLDTAREGIRQRAGLTEAPFAGSVTRLALGQVVAAVLRGVALSRLPALDVANWHRGFCPICGGWPDLGLLNADTNTQTIVCERCDTMWRYRRVGCPYCASDDDVHYYASSNEKVRISVCGVCGAYLKQAYLPLDIPVRSLLGLRLLTVGQDLDAQEAGLHRPLARQLQ